MSIGEVLLEKGLITPENLAEALSLRKKSGQRLDKVLVELKCISEEQILQVMSEQLGIPMVNLSEVEIDVDAGGDFLLGWQLHRNTHDRTPVRPYRRHFLPATW